MKIEVLVSQTIGPGSPGLPDLFLCPSLEQGGVRVKQAVCVCEADWYAARAEQETAERRDDEDVELSVSSASCSAVEASGSGSGSGSDWALRRRGGGFAHSHHFVLVISARLNVVAAQRAAIRSLAVRAVRAP